MLFATTDIPADIPTSTEEVIEQSNIVMDYVKSLIPVWIGYAIDVVLALVIYIIGVRVISYVRKLVRRIMERSNLDEGVKQFLDSFLKLVLYFLLIVLILTRFGVTTASVTALVGSVGLTIGLALQGSLANFAGGVLILVLKPFEIGDYIITESGKEGTVTQIKIFYTRMTTIDNRMVVIPNGKLSDGVITNVTKMDKRRLDMTFGIAYNADLKLAKELLESILNSDEARLEEDPVTVFVQELGASEVVLGCNLWVATENYLPSKFRIQEAVLNSFKEHHIEIPFPQVEVTVNK
ncbi:MAG: mechanosensitive ion channel [Lachnospiraceae bacterium]|nr:mechanosensitive ion channel [Lachnospiraceae bacterium]